MTSETGTPVQRPSDPVDQPDSSWQPDEAQPPNLRSRRPKALARAARQQELLAARSPEPPADSVPPVRKRTSSRISAWSSAGIWARGLTRSPAWKQTRSPRGAGMIAGVAVLGAVLVISCGAAVRAISGDHDPAPLTLSSGVDEFPSPVAGQGLPTAVPETPADGKGTADGKPRKSSEPETGKAATGSGNSGRVQNNGRTTNAGATSGGQKTSSGGQVSPTKAGAPAATTTTAAGGNTASSGGTQAAASNVVTVGVIRNLMTGFCADLPGQGSADENVLVRQNTCAPGASDNQQFQTVAAADGTFLLRNVASGWCLDVNGSGSVKSGTVVNTHECLSGSQDNQMFRKQAQSNGFFLVHVKTGMCLNVSNPYGVDNKVADLKLTLFACSAKDDHIWTFG